MKLLVVLGSVLCVCINATPVIRGTYPAFQGGERIIGGADAARNQFPYIVSLQWGIIGSYQHICGGSIVTSRTVLTAGHCITESPWLGSLRIKAGIILLNENVNTLQTIRVQSSLVHPNYVSGVNPHDLALLTLASALTFNEAVVPAALPLAGVIPTGNALLSGWGATIGSGSNTPYHLQWVQKPILSLRECSDALDSILGNNATLDATNICSGSATQTVSGCSGDSGGPLAQNGVVVGVVSWGIMPCGTDGAPSVYVGVSNYISWINENSI